MKIVEDRNRMMLDAIPTLAWCNLPDGSNAFLNQRWHDYTGLTPEESKGGGWKVVIHPEDTGVLLDKWRAVLNSGDSGEIEARLRRYDAEYRWFLLRIEPFRDEQGNIVRWYGTGADIENLKRAESLLAAEKRTLEMISSGARLADILANLCVTIDALSTNSTSTVLLSDPDGKRLWPAAGPAVPDSWTQTISPMTIGPREGSCGTAAFLRKRVIITDVASDLLCVGYRDRALANGIRASWSQPLISKSHELLGTFAMYYPEPRTPSASDLQLIEDAGHLAVIAIQGERSQAALAAASNQVRKSEAQLRTIIDAVPQLIAVLGSDGKNQYANQALLKYTGLTLEDVTADHFRSRVFHPEDEERQGNEPRNPLAQLTGFENEQRIRGRDGQYRWFLMQYNPLKDEQGEILQWYATGTDIEDRKRAEERIRDENFALREEIDHSLMFEEIVGSCKPLRRVLLQVSKVAATDSTVLISGETGTGKELIARAIHKRSNRSTRAFIRVNCAAIPPSLIASELFGHERGAFTGALQQRIGRFEAADGGTLFLDEVGDLPTETQIALLRVLQEREFERVGSSQPISLNVRVLAATNRDLKVAVDAGTFRKDLFYRFNVFPIQVPSLRERVDDIPLLVEYLIDRYSKKAGKKFGDITKKTLELFQAYDWPGNIRELQNVIERAVVLCDGETFSVDETWLKRESPPESRSAVPFAAARFEREREMIEAALAQSRGRIAGLSGAAKRLGIPRQTLDSKILSLGINKHQFMTQQCRLRQITSFSDQKILRR
jgi:formate hydrogenlyase transcriptional activator